MAGGGGSVHDHMALQEQRRQAHALQEQELGHPGMQHMC